MLSLTARVDVADGQCMLIVENGRVLDFCAEPGQYVYQTGTSPRCSAVSVSGIIWSATFEEIGRRFGRRSGAVHPEGVLYQYQGNLRQ